MASHWKSTPSYWCKFCSTYVRDTPIERKNHESSAKHQNSIQRSLRELHKTKAREDRDKQRAKDEVARLNGLVGGGKNGTQRPGGASITGATTVAASSAPKYDAAQRKAHAEQLVAMGVQLPDELKKEVTGVGEWETFSTRIVEGDERSGGASLADILKQESVKDESSKDAIVRGLHKRKIGDEDTLAEGEGSKKKAAWGSRLKTYPGEDAGESKEEDLDALLSGVAAKKKTDSRADLANATPTGGATVEFAETPGHDDESDIKFEVGGDSESGITAPPIPVFKKRKGRK